MRNKLLPALVALGLLAAVRCESQQPLGYPVAWDHPGRVGPDSTNPMGQSQFLSSFSAKDKASFTALAKDVFDILLRMPTLVQPQGFDVRTFASAQSMDIDDKSDSPRPHRVSGYMRVRMPLYQDVGDRIRLNGEYFAAEIFLESNRLRCVTTGDQKINMLEDERGKLWFPPPKLQGTHHGYPVWGKCVILTHRSAPFFVPVDQERVLNFIAAQAQKRLADFEKALEDNGAMIERIRKNSPDLWNTMSPDLQKTQKGLQDQAAVHRQFIATIKARIAGMTPQQRNSQAHIKMNYDLCCGPYELAAPDEPEAQSVVAFNPDFFDWTLPPTAPQIFAVRIEDEQGLRRPSGDMGPRLDGELDWAALEKLLQ